MSHIKCIIQGHYWVTYGWLTYCQVCGMDRLNKPETGGEND